MIHWLLLAACTGRGHGPDDPVPVDRSAGPLGQGPANPFPSLAHVDDDGHLALAGLPADGDTPIPVERLAWRTGFSPSQTAVLDLVGIDPRGLPTVAAPLGGSVRLVDVSAGIEVPCLAELDAHPQAVDAPALLVRPLTALAFRHEIAVVVLTEAVDRPAAFDPEWPPTAALLEALDRMGLPPHDVAVAWSFPVADGTRPLRTALAQRRTDALPAPVFSDVRVASAGDPVAPRTYRAAEGTFAATGVLDAAGLLRMGPDGAVVAGGTFEADVVVHVPASVADAPAGSVPMLVFGHGLFREPLTYLDSATDEHGLLALADEGGFIVVATRWRGLSSTDLGIALEVAGDFGALPKMTGLLVQSQLVVRELVEGLRAGDWADEAVFRGASGQALPDPGAVTYYGISLGAIEGAVLAASGAPVDASVLHVPGAMWSTMLERSSNWTLFEAVFVPAVPNPSDRQRLYATSQLWWDPVDPMSWATELMAVPVLLQEAVGDEQVPNLTTEALARAVSIPLLDPAVTDPVLAAVDLPLPDGTSALVQFDPELRLPVATNRPAATTGAHTLPRTFAGARGQAAAYLDPAHPGHLVHLCGAQACSASNPGVVD